MLHVEATCKRVRSKSVFLRDRRTSSVLSGMHWGVYNEVIDQYSHYRPSCDEWQYTGSSSKKKGHWKFYDCNAQCGSSSESTWMRKLTNRPDPLG